MSNDRLSKLIALSVLFLVVVAVGFWFLSPPDSDGRTSGLEYRSLMTQATRLAAQGRTTQVEKLCREAIALKTLRPEAFLLAAECARARGDVPQALSDLENVSTSDQDSWISATILKADIFHYETAEFSRAESAYLEVLAVSSDYAPANSGYARLLGLCGRRRDAIPQILRLIYQSAADDLLVLLSREEGAITDPELLAKAEKTSPNDPNLLLARANLAILSLDHDLAINLLTKAQAQPNFPSLIPGRLGRELLADNRQEDLVAWANHLPPSREWGAETWLVVGQLAEKDSDIDGAVRCYWETLRRWPESLTASQRLATLLRQQNLAEMAATMQDRVTRISRLHTAQQRAIMSRDSPDRRDMLELVDAYAACGRIAEAYAWGEMAVRSLPDEADLQSSVLGWAQQLRTQPLQLTLAEFNPANRWDLSEFQVPKSFQLPPSSINPDLHSSISFRKESVPVGFEFTYFNGVSKPSHRVFEFTGGGLGVFDLDNDECPDLLCTQGVRWEKGVRPHVVEPMASGDARQPVDTVFRNGRGERFESLPTGLALPLESGFGQGVSVGDINNDGFQDLYVANTHGNQLLISNGDGTFSNADGYRDHVASWTTSCLIADLNADGFPDLYDVNYLKSDDLFTRVCETDDGQPLMCGPEAFDGAADCVWLNDGRGTFTVANSEFLSPRANGKGLGIVAFSQQQTGLSLFVANDTVANHFFVPDSTKSNQTPGQDTSGVRPILRMQDQAFASGLAVNADGKSEACMGIAVSDINNDQRMDLVVTNFLHESNTVYVSLTDTLFQDQTRAVGLQAVSLPVLSFGTQFLDANCDGQPELFVGNGYTEDMPGDEIPYAMSPQLFEWNSKTFEQLKPESIGVWASREIVARAAARIDWNGDGLPDLAVGLLHEPSFLLTNQSDASNQTGLRVRFVATLSDRDSIGTTVTSKIDGQSQTMQLTAGDGYQCSNERILHLSGRQQNQIPELVVSWPSGETQVFRDIPASGRWVAVQGRNQLSLIP